MIESDDHERLADVTPWWMNALVVVLGGVVLLAAVGIVAEVAGFSDRVIQVIVFAVWLGPAPVILWRGHLKSPWPWWRNALWLFVAVPWLVGLGVVGALGFGF